MTTERKNYIIYKIVNLTQDVYYGATTQTINKVLINHKTKYNKFIKNGKLKGFISSFLILEKGNYSIEEVETLKDTDRKTANKRVKHYTDNDKNNVNILKLGQTVQEYRKKEEVKNKINNYQEKYRQEHQQEIKQYYKKNNNELKEYQRKYYKKNQEKINEEQKVRNKIYYNFYDDDPFYLNIELNEKYDQYKYDEPFNYYKYRHDHIKTYQLCGCCFNFISNENINNKLYHIPRNNINIERFNKLNDDVRLKQFKMLKCIKYKGFNIFKNKIIQDYKDFLKYEEEQSDDEY